MSATTYPIITRRLDGIRYLVPDTAHWAQWHDADAIRHHGIALVRRWETRDDCGTERITVREVRAWRARSWDALREIVARHNA
jgi:hypothetical protein